MLTGVSAGVIGLDRTGRINLPNRSASSLLGVDLEQSIGRDLAGVAPAMTALLDEAGRRPDRLAQSQVQLAGGNSTRTLLVRIAAEHDEGDISGYVVTFDDITELLSAQRKAAWADIARRIAHEIKNPLTPIQLAAERLRRRLPEGNQNQDPGNLYDLHRHDHPPCRRHRPCMIDEFSAFARMPLRRYCGRRISSKLSTKRCFCSVRLNERSRSRRNFRTIRPLSIATPASPAKR